MRYINFIFISISFALLFVSSCHAKEQTYYEPHHIDASLKYGSVPSRVSLHFLKENPKFCYVGLSGDISDQYLSELSGRPLAERQTEFLMRRALCLDLNGQEEVALQFAFRAAHWAETTGIGSHAERIALSLFIHKINADSLDTVWAANRLNEKNYILYNDDNLNLEKSRRTYKLIINNFAHGYWGVLFDERLVGGK